MITDALLFAGFMTLISGCSGWEGQAMFVGDFIAFFLGRWLADWNKSKGEL